MVLQLGAGAMLSMTILILVIVTATLTSIVVQTPIYHILTAVPMPTKGLYVDKTPAVAHKETRKWLHITAVVYYDRRINMSLYYQNIDNPSCIFNSNSHTTQPDFLLIANNFTCVKSKIIFSVPIHCLNIIILQL